MPDAADAPLRAVYGLVMMIARPGRLCSCRRGTSLKNVRERVEDGARTGRRPVELGLSLVLVCLQLTQKQRADDSARASWPGTGGG
jgi:hypothetical protein